MAQDNRLRIEITANTSEAVSNLDDLNNGIAENINQLELLGDEARDSETDFDRLKKQLDETESVVRINLLAQKDTAEAIQKTRENTEKLDKTLKNNKQQTEENTGAVNGLKGSFDGIGDVVFAPIAAAFASFTAVIADGVQKFREFELEMAKIQAVSHSSKEDMAALAKTAEHLGATTQFSAKEAAEGMKELASAGFTTKEVMEGIPGVLNLAAAGGQTLEEAALSTVSAIGQFNLSAKDAADIADTFVSAANAGALSTAELSESLKVVGPVASSLGLSLDDTAKYIAILSDAGIKGSEAGTALRGALAALANPSADAIKELDRLGVSVTNANGKMLPFQTILDGLKDKGMTAAQSFNIFGTEATPAVLAFTNTAKERFIEVTKAVTENEEESKKAAATISNTLDGSIKTLASSYDALAMSMGRAFSEELRGTSKEWVAAMDHTKSSLESLSGAFGSVVGSISSVTANIIGMIGEGWGIASAAMTDWLEKISLVSEAEKELTRQRAAYAIEQQKAADANQAYEKKLANLIALKESFFTVQKKVTDQTESLTRELSGLDNRTASMINKLKDSVNISTDLDAIFNRFKEISLFDGTEKSTDRLLSGLKQLGDAANVTGDQIKTRIADAIKNMDPEGLQRLQNAVEKTGWDFLELGESSTVVLEEILKKGITDIGLNFEEVTNKVRDDEKKLIGSFELIGESALSTGPMIRAAFTEVLEKIDTKAALGQFESLFKEIAAKGKLSTSEVAVLYEKLSEKIASSADSVSADIKAAFNRMGVESKQALDGAAAQAEKDFETIKNSGLATNDALVQAADKYRAAAEATGDAQVIAQANSKTALYQTKDALTEVTTKTEEASTAAKELNEIFNAAMNTIDSAQTVSQIESVIRKLGDLERAGKLTPEEIGKAFEAANAKLEVLKNTIEEFTSPVLALRNELGNLSEAAGNAFAKIGYGEIKKVSEGIDALADSATEVDREFKKLSGNFDNGTFLGYFAALEKTAADIKRQFYDQALAAEELSEKLAGMNNASLVVINSAKRAADGYHLLDQQSLDGIRSQVDRLRQANEALDQSVQSTLANLENELDQLLGNQRAIEERNYQERLKSLDEFYKQAKEAQNADALAAIEKAKETAKKIHEITLKQINEKEIDSDFKTIEVKKQENSKTEPIEVKKQENSKTEPIEVKKQENSKTEPDADTKNNPLTIYRPPEHEITDKAQSVAAHRFYEKPSEDIRAALPSVKPLPVPGWQAAESASTTMRKVQPEPTQYPPTYGPQSYGDTGDIRQASEALREFSRTLSGIVREIADALQNSGFDSMTKIEIAKLRSL
jgi:TP901 family phage tail tape measure protein